MSMAIVYQEAFKTVVRMQSGQLVGKTASQIQAAFLNLFSSIQDDARHGRIPYALDVLEDAEFALAAFADEAALLSNDHSISSQWTDGKGSLTQQLFNQHHAGNDFYQRLEKISRVNSPEAGEILEVYGLCLLLGYTGAKKGHELDTLKRDVVQQIERVLGKSPRLSVGEESLTQEARPRKDMLISKLGFAMKVAALVAAIAYLVYSVDLRIQSAGLAQLATWGQMKQ